MSPPQSSTTGLQGFRPILTVWPICLCRRAQRRPSCTDGLRVRVDPGWSACPPTRPTGHTLGITMRTEEKGQRGGYPLSPLQRPSPRCTAPPVRCPLRLESGLVALKFLVLDTCACNKRSSYFAHAQNATAQAYTGADKLKWNWRPWNNL